MNLGMPEMIFIFLIALLVFGPRKLPEIGRQIGKFMAEFKRASNEFKYQIEAEVQKLELEEELKKETEKLQAELRQTREELAQVAASVPTILPPEGAVVHQGSSSSPFEQQIDRPSVPEAPNPDSSKKSDA